MLNIKSGCIFIFFLVFSGISVAQIKKTNEGNIGIIKDARLDALLKRYNAINKKKGSIQGFRIQLVASTNRADIYKVKSKFYSLFPEHRPYVVYQQPNFKLRIGNYRTRLEAYRDLQEILPQFNDAFIIIDELKIEEL